MFATYAVTFMTPLKVTPMVALLPAQHSKTFLKIGYAPSVE